MIINFDMDIREYACDCDGAYYTIDSMHGLWDQYCDYDFEWRWIFYFGSWIIINDY